MTVLGLIQTVGVYRYRLLWARARDTRYRATFISGGVLWLLLAAYLAMTTAAAAYAAVRLAQTLAVVTLVLTVIFGAAIAATITIGAGTRRAFSDRMLRRFPITPRRRLLIVHATGLLEPFWLAVIILMIAFATTLVAVGGAGIGYAATGALLFVLCTYASAIVAGSVGDRVLASPRSSAMVALLILVAAVTLPHVVRSYPTQTLAGARVIGRVLPAGIAARTMTGASAATAWDVLALLAWLGLLTQTALAVAAIERRPHGGHGPLARSRTTNLLPSAVNGGMSAVATKVALYYLRSLRLRVSIVLVPIAVAVFARGASHSAERFFVTLAMLALSGTMGTAIFVFNQFGFDGVGVQRYRRWPVPFHVVLRAASAVGAVVGLLFVAVAWATAAVIEPQLSGVALLTLLGAGISGTAIFHAAGLVTTVACPGASHFDRVRGTQLPYTTTLVLFSLAGAVFMVTGLLMQWPALAGTWPLAAGVWGSAALGVLCYGLVWIHGTVLAAPFVGRCVRLIVSGSDAQ